MIEQRVTLRYGAQQIPAIVQAVQGDTGRDVIFELADYEIPAGATANYYIDKPDDTAIYNSAEVISSTEIRAHLTEQALAEPGRNNGQVRVLSDGEVITSFDFVLEVEAFRGILRLQSETEVNIFDQAIEDAVNTATEEAVAEIQAQTPVVTGMQNSIAPTYSSSSTYAVGDYVMYNAQLYRCVTAITTAEAWTAVHWIHVPIAPEVSGLKRSIGTYLFSHDKSISMSNPTTMDTESNWECVLVECSAGDVFYVKGKGGNNTRLWFFSDSSENVLSSADAQILVPKYTKIVAPENAMYLSVNSNYTTIKGALFDDKSITQNRIDDINDEIDDINDDINDIERITLINYGYAQNDAYDNNNITITPSNGVNVINGTPTANIGLEISRFTSAYDETVKLSAFDSAHSTAFCYVTDINSNTRVATCYGGNVESFNVIAGHVYKVEIYIPGYTAYNNYTLEIVILSAKRSTAIEYFPVTITASNYGKYLPDADKALPNVKYRISSRAIPAHFPAITHNPLNCYLETLKSDDNAIIQYIKDLETDVVLWKRLSTSTWSSKCHAITVGKGSGDWDFDSLYDALQFAYSNDNTTIDVYDGEYDIIDEMGSDLTSSSIGILLGKGTTINFKPHAYIVCNYTGDDANIKGIFSPFYAGMGDFEINNMKLSCSNVRYCVHDEKSDGSDAYSHKYNNCVFYLDNSANQYGYPQCIGGGLGKNGHIEIVGCSFESETISADGEKAEASYHNSSASGAKSELFVKDNFFTNGTFRISYYGASTDITHAYVSNNSVKFTPFVSQENPSYTTQNVALHEWNNPIRT